MQRYKILISSIFILLFLVVMPLAAQDTATIHVNFSDEGVSVPSEIHAGLVTFHFENTKTEAPAVVDLGRLKDDVTPESFIETMTTAEDPFAALALVTLHGGTEIYPDAPVQIAYQLEVGSYVLLDFAGQPAFFEVIEAEESVEATPEATESAATVIDVELDDFAFIAPDEIASGETTWHITNMGEQWHEMALYRITDSELTTEEISAFLLESATAEEEMTLEGLEMAGIWLPMDAGTEAWVNWDLEPGFYVLSCFLPDMASEEMHSHISLGMIRFITVTE